MATEKPTLFLLKTSGGLLTAERLAALYEKLTGKKPTAEELEAARRQLANQSGQRHSAWFDEAAQSLIDGANRGAQKDREDQQ